MCPSGSMFYENDSIYVDANCFPSLSYIDLEKIRTYMQSFPSISNYLDIKLSYLIQNSSLSLERSSRSNLCRRGYLEQEHKNKKTR